MYELFSKTNEFQEKKNIYNHLSSAHVINDCKLYREERKRNHFVHQFNLVFVYLPINFHSMEEKKSNTYTNENITNGSQTKTKQLNCMYSSYITVVVETE